MCENTTENGGDMGGNLERKINIENMLDELDMFRLGHRINILPDGIDNHTVINLFLLELVRRGGMYDLQRFMDNFFFDKHGYPR